ncbi:MAG: hypothetical protein DHS80DRAFT_15768 [Piptocephalis tieghemiana]|nr:MAG: hypothetical protein DHS80DRAFT_15768 [Piptocephalis tieghemiana]
MLLRLLPDLERWSIPVVCTVLRDLRDLSILADRRLADGVEEGMDRVEEAARIIHKAFTICLTHKAPSSSVTLQWGVHALAALLFSVYVILGKESNCKSILRALKAAGKDLPSLPSLPMSHQVAFRYYVGIVAFREGDGLRAEEELGFSLIHCHKLAKGNMQRILLYLVPLRLLRGKAPARALLTKYPGIQQTYGDILSAVRDGAVGEFDRLLRQRISTLARVGTYLVVEKARFIALRQLFRKVWIYSGKSSRIPMSQFQTALRVAGLPSPSLEETECILANLIYREYMKGYLSHEWEMVVLKKGEPFPPLSQVSVMGMSAVSSGTV